MKKHWLLDSNSYFLILSLQAYGVNFLHLIISIYVRIYYIDNIKVYDLRTCLSKSFQLMVKHKE